MGKRGSVLLHVLMTGVLIALISATLLRLALMRFTATQHAAVSTRERRYDEAALAMLVSKWNANNKYCMSASDGNVAYTCNANGGAGFAAPLNNCSCSCSNNSSTSLYPQTITGGGAAPTCTLSVVSADINLKY